MELQTTQSSKKLKNFVYKNGATHITLDDLILHRIRSNWPRLKKELVKARSS